MSGCADVCLYMGDCDESPSFFNSETPKARKSHEVCDTKMFEMLWESMDEQMFPVWREKGPFDCLAKLTRETARDLCRTRFAMYMEDYE